MTILSTEVEVSPLDLGPAAVSATSQSQVVQANKRATTTLYSSNHEHKVKEFGCLVICGLLWQKIKESLRNDFLGMVLPSIFTKTFGRTLMVLHVIHFKSFGSFLIQNLKFAAPEIALMAGLVVFCYHLHDQKMNKNKNWWTAFKFAGANFIKTSFKFFMVYMGWTIAMAIVTKLGWFVGPIGAQMLTALIIFSVFAVALGASRFILHKYFPNNKRLETLVNIVLVTVVFAGVAAFAYFANPLLAGLLVVGGITALSLMFATIITDVLPNPKEKMTKAWKMIARAYSEGIVWAFVEKLAISEIIPAPFGGILDVAATCVTVCIAIIFGGVFDTKARHWFDKRKRKTSEKRDPSLKEEVTTILTLPLEKNGQLITRIEDFCSRQESRSHEYHAFFKRKLGLELLKKLDECDSVPHFRKTYNKVLKFIRQPLPNNAASVAVNNGKVSSYLRIKNVIEAREAYIAGKTTDEQWERVKKIAEEDFKKYTRLPNLKSLGDNVSDFDAQNSMKSMFGLFYFTDKAAANDSSDVADAKTPSTPDRVLSDSSSGEFMSDVSMSESTADTATNDEAMPDYGGNTKSLCSPTF